jgi:hypothetical protein
MSSLKSLAAAKSRRSNGEQHITSGTRPGTSIASQSAFAGQYQGRTPGQQPQMNRFQEQQQVIHDNGLPFTKLTVSDAIGLITLRLGKVEKYLIDVQHEGGFNNNMESNIPENTKLIDNSVLTSIIHRLDSLEKKEQQNTGGSSQTIVELTNKNDKLEKELKEVRDILLNFRFKYELFTTETSNRFLDYEMAIKEIENNITFQTEESTVIANEHEIEHHPQPQPVNEIEDNINLVMEEDGLSDKILSAELKNLIKQEFSENSEV